MTYYIQFIVAMLVLMSLSTIQANVEASRSFQIDYTNNRFLKDGTEFRYVSGSIHYFRVRPEDWRDRLKKLRHSGFNAVQTYVEWSSHEPEPGVYNFMDDLDLVKFITTAQEEDLVVILRPGPFICAERDMGGLPYWLLREQPDIVLRTADPKYMKYVKHWMGEVLLPKIRRYMYENGGPIIMVQVENEYGSGSPCDYTYTAQLREIFKDALGPSAVLFTTDNGSIQGLRCGKIPGVYATVDFGPDVDARIAFAAQRLFEPHGPLVNSEFYSGWDDFWGQPHNSKSPEALAKSLDQILSLNASVNMYMFHGGTSFGLKSGATSEPGNYNPSPTSYDYSAPLSEAGDPTIKYYALRNITAKYLPLPPGPIPQATPKYTYGSVKLSAIGNIQQLIYLLQRQRSKYPLTFEQMDVPNGIVVYQTIVPFLVPDPSLLDLQGVHDRGYVLVNDRMAGTVSRQDFMLEIPIRARPDQLLTIIVESQGRINGGPHLNDFKGLTKNVTLNNHILENWTITPIPLLNYKYLYKSLKILEKLGIKTAAPSTTGGLTFYRGVFEVPGDPTHPRDTFVRLDGWTKGIIWINHFCLGRYWPVMGPQINLYVPHGILKHGSNSVLILELEEAPCISSASCFVRFIDTPEVDGPTPE